MANNRDLKHLPSDSLAFRIAKQLLNQQKVKGYDANKKKEFFKKKARLEKEIKKTFKLTDGKCEC